MFKKNFVRLCNKINKPPTVVCIELGLNKATFSNWKDDSVPHARTLEKIADYFGVSVESLISDELEIFADTRLDSNEFWDNFVELCIKKGQSPNSVCDALGYSTAVATKWKRGSIPRDTTVRKIADYFEVSVDYLISGQKETPTVSDGLDDEILMLYSQLPPDKRKQADDYLRFLVQNSKNGES